MDPDTIPVLPFSTFCLIAFNIYVLVEYWYTDQLPSLVAAHPEIDFQSVSGWYGPGSWLAFVFTAVNALWSTMRESRDTQAARPKWNPDVVGSIVYSMLVSADLIKKRREVKSAELEEVFPVLPALSAAVRATCFSAMIMELCLLAHIGQLVKLKLRDQSWIPNWSNLAPTLLVWVASIFPLAAVSAAARDVVIATNKAVNSTSNSTSTDYQLFIETEFNLTGVSIFAFCECISQFLPIVTALRPRYPRDISDILFFYLIPYGISACLFLFVFQVKFSPIKTILLLCLAPFVWSMWGLFWLCIIYFFAWPLYCILVALPIISLSIIPQHFAIFPYSGISFSEMDQYGALALVLALYFLRASNAVANQRMRQWVRGRIMGIWPRGGDEPNLELAEQGVVNARPDGAA